MKFLLFLSACFAPVISQDPAICADLANIQQVNPKNVFIAGSQKTVGKQPYSNPWDCLCEQIRANPNRCEQQVLSYAIVNPGQKLCKDRPIYYFGKNQECYDETEHKKFSTKALEFACDLFHAMDPKDSAKNFIFSPLSPQILLSQLTDGCSELAKQEMLKVLRLNTDEVTPLMDAMYDAISKDSDHIKLDIVSSFFKSQNINLTDKFNEARKNRRIELASLDFTNTAKAASILNAWVSVMTREKIKEIVNEQSLSPDLSLLLLNAIYFRGTWEYKFNRTDTTDGSKFSTSATSKIPVQMMTMSNPLRFGEIFLEDYSDRGLRWVELPYSGDQLSMILMLPKRRLQLDNALKDLNVTHLKEVFRTIQDDNRPINIKVHLPKFTISDSVSLVEPLKMLSLRRIFEDPTALSGVSKTAMKVNDVKQKSYLSVDEEGTTATTITEIGLVPLSANPTMHVSYVFDEPFFAMVVDKTNEIPLFMAKINQPLMA